MINGFDDVQKAGREGMNRALESFGALSRGWQTLATETAGYSKKSFEESAAQWKRCSARSPSTSPSRRRANFVRSAYEKAVGQAARFGELYMDLVKDVTKPFEDFVPAGKK